MKIKIVSDTTGKETELTLEWDEAQDQFTWFDQDGNDTEVSGHTVREAEKAAADSWGRGWDMFWWDEASKTWETP